MSDYRLRVEVEYEAVQSTLSTLPERLEPLVRDTATLFDRFKREIDEAIC